MSVICYTTLSVKSAIYVSKGVATENIAATREAALHDVQQTSAVLRSTKVL